LQIEESTHIYLMPCIAKLQISLPNPCIAKIENQLLYDPNISFHLTHAHIGNLSGVDGGEPSGSCGCEGPVDGGEEMLGTGKREGSSEAGKEEEMPEK
jgi:hypothetical protein